MVLYCNFRSLAFLGLLGFLIRQLKVQLFTTLLSAAKSQPRNTGRADPHLQNRRRWRGECPESSLSPRRGFGGRGGPKHPYLDPGGLGGLGGFRV